MIVTLCGSARFEDHFKTWNEALTMAGHTVFTLTRYPSEKGAKLWYTDAQKAALDEAHKRKINASEAVLVLNVFGYMGPSTLGEVEHAKSRGKALYALESWGKGNGIGGMHFDHVQEACRRAIPEGYVGSPIDTTSNSGFRYAYDLLDDVVTHERSYDLVKMVQACDERLRTPGVAIPSVPQDVPFVTTPDGSAVALEKRNPKGASNDGFGACVTPKNDDDALLIDNLFRACLSRDSAAIDGARMALRQRMNELRAAGVDVPPAPEQKGGA